MDDSGNILIKRNSTGCPVFARGWNWPNDEQQSALTMDIVKAGGLITQDRPTKLFDMKRFTQNIERELRSAYPDRRKLENQCISLLLFAKSEHGPGQDLLDLPLYVMIVNIVAIDMLR